MAGSVNKVILVGHLGGDPEIKTTQDGREFAKFSLATSEFWKDKNTGERKERTEWHRVIVFNQGLTQVIKNYIRKGSKLYLEGSMQTREYTAEDGTKRYTTEVVLQGFNSNLTMLDRKESSDTMGHISTNTIPLPSTPAPTDTKAVNDPLSNTSDQAESKKPTVAEMLDDEVPF